MKESCFVDWVKKRNAVKAEERRGGRRDEEPQCIQIESCILFFPLQEFEEKGVWFKVEGRVEEVQHAVCVWEIFILLTPLALAWPDYNDKSEQSRNLASLVEGWVEWGGVLWDTMGAASGRKLACGLMWSLQLRDRPFTVKTHKSLKGLPGKEKKKSEQNVLYTFSIQPPVYPPGLSFKSSL